ncbi:MAG TPA: 5-dehydro-2-deoxygluconokinase [Marmoricola sp.]|nr:5-dehydro-2-deoxygluconokinase [Marmoricola sp.]
MTHPAADPVTPFEVITMGRVGVDIYPQQIGVPLEEVTTFAKFLGGSPTNVAVAAARHGRRVAVITRTGADPFGRYVHQALRGFGVDDRFITDVADLPTPVTFCEIFPPDDFPLYFYRLPTAPDLQIHADELDLDAIAAADVFWVTGTGLCEEPSRSATMAALKARDGHGTTILDLDYRPMFWSSRTEAHQHIHAAVELVDVAVGNLDECETAVGERDPDRAAAALLDAGVRLAVVKQGPAGVLGAQRGESVVVPPVPVEVVNGLGAGDAFGGALCHGLLAGWDVERTLHFANAAGAIVAGRLACADAMPTTAELEALLGEAS